MGNKKKKQRLVVVCLIICILLVIGFLLAGLYLNSMKYTTLHESSTASHLVTSESHFITDASSPSERSPNASHATKIPSYDTSPILLDLTSPPSLLVQSISPNTYEAHSNVSLSSSLFLPTSGYSLKTTSTQSSTHNQSAPGGEIPDMIISSETVFPHHSIQSTSLSSPMSVPSSTFSIDPHNHTVALVPLSSSAEPIPSAETHSTFKTVSQPQTTQTTSKSYPSSVPFSSLTSTTNAPARTTSFNQQSEWILPTETNGPSITTETSE